VNAPRTARERARLEITQEIVDTARDHLSTYGAAGLSLRAVARDLGMASSAVYRYFPSRDDLLTRLILDAFNGLGGAAEAAEARVDRGDLLGRHAALWNAVRGWAVARPQEYLLIYGSPVPGYVAPVDTVQPATRVSALLTDLLVDGLAAGRVHPPTESVPRRVRAAVAPARAYFPRQIGDDLLLRGLISWAGMFGAITFELNGMFHNVVGDAPGDRQAYFEAAIVRTAAFIGLDQRPPQDPPAAARG
jgi:AcrR family transcriptional regulator